MRLKRPRIPQDLGMKLALGGLLIFAYGQWLTKAALVDVMRRMKARKKSL